MGVTYPKMLEMRRICTLLLLALASCEAVIKHPPKITKQPNSEGEVLFKVASAQGEDDLPITIPCEAIGEPLPKYQWVKNGEDFDWQTYDNRISQQPGQGTLVITSPRDEDIGLYQCFAQNELGTATSNSAFVRKSELNSFNKGDPIGWKCPPPEGDIVNVKVGVAPYFTQEPEIQNKAEGEVVEFVCETEGNPPPEQYWIFNGMLLDKIAPNPRRVVENNKIIIYNLTKADTGNYGCNSSNTHGYVYKDVYVNVLALAPEITTPPMDTEFIAGQVAKMTCRVIGAPKPSVKWVKGGKYLTGGRYTTSDKGDLIIRDVTFTDEGDYMCFAENKFGKQEAHGRMVVNKKQRTKITEAPQDYEVAAGQTATFRCKAIADNELKLRIYWMKEDEEINFSSEPRFVMYRDFSIAITKTTELDSGIYTCIARTYLDRVLQDEVQEKATLIVQDKPNPPQLVNVICNDPDASVEWMPMGDNRAPILGYDIQFSTSFTPDNWENANGDSLPATSTQFTMSMSPWANYTFRVIARNKIGPSEPSRHSQMCSTPEDVPYKNPDSVQGEGTNPTNLVIKWSAMPEIDHNGLGFKYRVYWKREDVENAQWSSDDVVDWQQDHMVIEDQPMFKPYRIKVEAHNDKGQANVAAAEVRGWSGEDVPLAAPQNLAMMELCDTKTALLAWEPVSNESIRGHFKGYKIQTWTENEWEGLARDIIVENNTAAEGKAIVDSLVPYSKNFLRVLVFNGAHNGPPSETIHIETPEGVPGPVYLLDAIPMGSNAFYLTWRQPNKHNGILTGYNIYHQEIQGINALEMSSQVLQIDDPTLSRAKLSSLKHGTKYRITIKAKTMMGEGEPYFIERSTRATGQSSPGKPGFIWRDIQTENGIIGIRITWIPNTYVNPGSHFYVQYRLTGTSQFLRTKDEFHNDYIVLKGLESDKMYEVRIVAVDGEFETNSDIEEILTNFGGIHVSPICWGGC